MTRKHLFVLGVNTILMVLLFASVASAQFARITGDTGNGFGYGYGFGNNYGWDAYSSTYSGTGYNIGGEKITWAAGGSADVWGYGYGYGFRNDVFSGYTPVGTTMGTYAAIPSGVFNLLISGIIGADGFASTGPTDTTFSGLTFYAPITFALGSGMTVEIDAGTVLSIGRSVSIADPANILVGNTNVSTSDFPTGYTATPGGALQFGVPNLGVTVNPPITINIGLGAGYNGTILKVLSKSAGGSWALLTTCTVSGGVCSFQTSHLSSFSAATYVQPSVVSYTSSGGGGGGANTSLALATSTPNNLSETISPVLITKVLRYKMYSVEVKKLQQLLKDLGYLSIKKTTTYFGLTTKTALKKYQKDHKLKISGITDVATRKALNQENGNAPLIVQPAMTEVFTKDLAYKSNNNMVKTLQAKLKELGYFAGNLTNYFGLSTKKAVMSFQKDKGIKPANGKVGPATRAILNKI